MNRVLMLIFFIIISISTAHADNAIVVKRFGSCDYFIADGPRGLYVLEWYGGYDPQEGDRISGDIASYGFKDVYYPDLRRTGRVYVEDFLASVESALEEIRDHC